MLGFPPYWLLWGATWGCSGGRWELTGAAVAAAGRPRVHQERGSIDIQDNLLWGRWGCSGGCEELGPQWWPLGRPRCIKGEEV